MQSCNAECSVVATLFYKPPSNVLYGTPLYGPQSCSQSDNSLSHGMPSHEGSARDANPGQIAQRMVAGFLTTVESILTSQYRLRSVYRQLDRMDSLRLRYPRVIEVVLNITLLQAARVTIDVLRRHPNLLLFERAWNTEVVMQNDDVYRKRKKMAVFDMDSTLIRQEVIDEIAAHIGAEKEVSQITARAMAGSLDFTSSLEQRVSLLKDISADVLQKVRTQIAISTGARELCRALKSLGYEIAVISGGFQPLTEWLAEELGLDDAFANHLQVDPRKNTFTGRLLPAASHQIVSPTRKRDLLCNLARLRGLSLAQVVAVGDGANDLPMLHAAGLGIAWNAKAKVQKEAPVRLNNENLLDVLYLLGLSKDEIMEVTQG